MTERYSASLTREKFLFTETRIVARLIDAGRTDEEIYQQIAEENLFQLPTEKSMRSIARPCIRRLRALGDAAAVHAIATQTADAARQLTLYAMMRDSRLVAAFMVTVIGGKYRMHDPNFSRSNVRLFPAPRRAERPGGGMERVDRQTDCRRPDADPRAERIPGERAREDLAGGIPVSLCPRCHKTPS